MELHKSDDGFSETLFVECIQQIVDISDKLYDGWTLHECENNTRKFITKKSISSLHFVEQESENQIVTFEFHVVYHSSYGVPILAFDIWKQDGSFLSMEEYWKSNPHLKDTNMYSTLTQLDHPILCRPILTLHPCHTQEIMKPFMKNSKNPVISWLTVVASFVQLGILEEYIKAC